MRIAARIHDRVLRNPRPWAYASVFVIAILLYLPTLRYGFIGYDDTLLVVNNHTFLSKMSNVSRAFTQDAFEVPGYNSSNAYYRPIMTVSLMIDAALGKTAPFVYHLDNILEHAVGSCLVLAVLMGLGYSLLSSLLLSLLFAVHPVFAGVVAWVPGRVDSLMTIFALTTVLGLLEYLRRGGALRYAWHILAFALTAFTKEVGVFLPIPMVLCLLAVRQKRIGGGRLARLLPGWGVVLIAWFFLRRTAVSAPQATGDLVEHLARNLAVLIHYLGKALIPIHLSATPTIEDTPLYPGVAALVLLAAALVLSKGKRVRFVALGVVWFFIFAAPSLVVPRFIGLEQRLYLPMMGILILLLETDLTRLITGTRFGPLTVVCVLLLFAGLSVGRASIYSSRLTFWENAVMSSPHSSYARASLGAVYVSRGRTEDARAQYERALELNPIEPKVNGNLGVIAAREGRRDEARRYFLKEISVNPQYADAYFNLGQSYAESGDLQNAVKMWEEALRVRPDHRDALLSLARYYTAQGRSDRAEEYVRRLEARR